MRKEREGQREEGERQDRQAIDSVFFFSGSGSALLKQFTGDI